MDCDLRNQAAVNAFFLEHKFTHVIHLAASVGGIGANKQNPGKYCYENLIMGCNVIEAARLANIKKVVCVGTVCSYPKFCQVPFVEEDLWKGYPEETNAPYGIAKKAILEMLKGYHTQYGMDYTYLIPVNMYGEFDNFDPKSSHVIPALVDKIIAAKRKGSNTIEVWGTGKATREFVHASDVANAIVKALYIETDVEPLNVGSGEEISIADLVDKIAIAAEWSGKMKWLSDKPDGQPRRLISSEKAYRILDYQPEITLDEGLKRLVAWREATCLPENSPVQ
jgi:nucleoside-diphosphate-sugar epimerase